MVVRCENPHMMAWSLHMVGGTLEPEQPRARRASFLDTGFKAKESFFSPSPLSPASVINISCSLSVPSPNALNYLHIKLDLPA